MVTGRPNKGLGHVDTLQATGHAKERLYAILATVAGRISVHDASQSIGLRPARFAELRRIALQGAADALAPRRVGRRPSTTPGTRSASSSCKRRSRSSERSCRAPASVSRSHGWLPACCSAPRKGAPRRNTRGRRA